MIQSPIKLWWVEDVWGPVEELFIRWGLTPNQISVIGLSFCFISSLILGAGFLLLGAWLLFLSASLDFLDGRIARRTNQQTAGGAFLDSVFDRYADFFVLSAVGFYFREQTAIFVLCLFAILGSFVTPYIRAKSESLGIPCNAGLMQRPERIFVIGLGALLSGLAHGLIPHFWILSSSFWLDFPLTLSVAVIAVFSNWTAIQRLRSSFKQCSSGV